jgi:hypothetical protein
MIFLPFYNIVYFVHLSLTLSNSLSIPLYIVPVYMYLHSTVLCLLCPSVSYFVQLSLYYSIYCTSPFVSSFYKIGFFVHLSLTLSNCRSIHLHIVPVYLFLHSTILFTLSTSYFFHLSLYSSIYCLVCLFLHSKIWFTLSTCLLLCPIVSLFLYILHQPICFFILKYCLLCPSVSYFVKLFLYSSIYCNIVYICLLCPIVSLFLYILHQPICFFILKYCLLYPSVSYFVQLSLYSSIYCTCLFLSYSTILYTIYMFTLSTCLSIPLYGLYFFSFHNVLFTLSFNQSISAIPLYTVLFN